MSDAISIMGRVAKSDTTQVVNKKPYFLEGQYKVEVRRCAAIMNRNGQAFFVVEGAIHESTHPDRPKGMVCAQVIKLGIDAGPPNVKHFICCALGLDPSLKENDEQITEDVCVEVVSDDQPLAGTIMPLSCSMVTTKAGKPFTVHTWSPALQMPDEEN